MKNKVVLLTGMAVGYVLGTRAGREQYERIRSQARSLWGDPRVQEQVSHVQRAVKEQVPVVQEKVSEVTRKGGDRSPGAGAGGTTGTDPNLNESGGGI